jgi:predicted AlkP superfamily pyrophosphatase or phosphodiesterase
LVRVPTLFDRLHAVGYRSSEVNWPCTRGSKTLQDSFPDAPNQIAHMTPRLRDELSADGWLAGIDDAAFRELSAPSRDQIWTAAASHLIRKRQPNLLLFHMLVTDSLQHKYGPRSPGAYAALALADAQVAEVLRALDAAGSRERTTLIVTADHGFAGATRFVSPNVAFRKAGLLEAGTAPAPVRARVQSISEGGVALVYLNSAATRNEDQARVLELMKSQEGIERVILTKDLTSLGFPDPALHPQMSALVLVAREGYAFSNEFRGDDAVSPVTLTVGNLGHHGVLATEPAMRPAFIAWGRGIRKGARLPAIDNVDVAPTIARLLGQTLPGAEGRVLTELLE